MKQPKTIALACMLYRALLHLAPKKGGLDECETLILSDFRAQCRNKYQQRGSWGVLALWLTTLTYTIRDIGFERFDVIKLFFARLFSVKKRNGGSEMVITRMANSEIGSITISLAVLFISELLIIHMTFISKNILITLSLATIILMLLSLIATIFEYRKEFKKIYITKNTAKRRKIS